MKIHQIKAKPVFKNPIKRVAAYARVSSDKVAAEDSLQTQTSYFEHYINSNAGYMLAGIYADNGISGTNPNRPEFQRMMADARAGKIDLIITKSVSRFARNVVTLLSALRELKELDIDVYFENENIHSISEEGEMIISLLAMNAEEGARSASENMRWRIEKQFERGIPTWSRMLGLKWVNGQFIVVPEEAKVVRRIFELYLDGKGRNVIITILKKEGLTSLNTDHWSTITIYSILRNEKYAGDLLLQKYYRPDFRTKKKYENRGERRRYYIEDAHEAIIPREMFNKVQEEIKRRQKLVTKQADYSEKLFAGIIKCHDCGWHYTRKHRLYDKSNYYWICNRYSSYGKDRCPNKEIRETVLINKTKQVLNIPANQTLTKDIIQKEIEHIEAMPDNKLRFFLKNGDVKIVAWKTPSRSKSWTPEMREKARQKTLAYYQTLRNEK